MHNTINKVVTREGLLQTFEELQGEFTKSESNAKAFDARFEYARSMFQSKILEKCKSVKQKIKDENELAKQMSEFIHMVEDLNNKWVSDLRARDKGLEFRAGYNDSLLVFVYGKVKSGKSSLGNYVAWGLTEPTQKDKDAVQEDLRPRYKSHAQTNVTGGDTEKQAESNSEFRVGATEATSSIQSFSLPGLTWVDSPGLHSVNPENGELADEYVNHADLILYTMKSDAPGRATDMEEIKMLMEKDKRFLLLLTGSDTVEDDENEDGEIFSVRKMKESTVREEQKHYVSDELQKVTDKSVEIISLSALIAQQHQAYSEEYADSGMGELFAVLNQLVRSDGVKIKRRAPLRNYLKFIGACSIDIQKLNSGISPMRELIENLQKDFPHFVKTENHTAQDKLKTHIDKLFREIDPETVDEDKINQKLKGIEREALQACTKYAELALQNIFSKIISEYEIGVQKTIDLTGLEKVDFEITMATQQREEVKKGNKGLLKAIGGIIGGSLGLLFSGGLLSFVGASVGGYIGEMLGDDTEIVEKTYQVKFGDNLYEINEKIREYLIQELNKAITEIANRNISDLIDGSNHLIDAIEQECNNIQIELDFIDSQLKQAIT